VLGGPLAAALERSARLSSRQAGIALVYHRVGSPPGDSERELLPALGASLFSAQLRHVTSRYRIVAASELMRAARERRRGERFPLAITFDDDLGSHVDVAAPLLRSAGATATFFLTGASLSGPQAFWWERLQAAVDRGLDLSSLGLRTNASASIHEVGRAIESLPPGDRDRVDAELTALVGRQAFDRGLQVHDIERLAASGFEIGFHTRRHDRLPPLEPQELERAMREGRDERERPLARRLSSISYPHGRADTNVARAARSAGFEVGFTGRPEPVTPPANSLLLGRLSPSYDSVGELAFDVAWTLLRARGGR
jgi:peptidoglycan/xylan/chitin deacetylase (PgdA/CDA1 family)